MTQHLGICGIKTYHCGMNYCPLWCKIRIHVVISRPLCAKFTDKNNTFCRVSCRYNICIFRTNPFVGPKRKKSDFLNSPSGLTPVFFETTAKIKGKYEQSKLVVMYARERQYLHNFAPKGHKIKLETSQSLVKSRKEAEKHAKSLAETRNLAQKKAANASNAYSQQLIGCFLGVISPYLLFE